MANFIFEDQIEKAAVSLLTDTYGYRTINCYTADVENLNDKSNRTTKQEVVFTDILKEYAIKLNPSIPASAIEYAIDILQNFTTWCREVL
jgi:type I restriction enzyme R subunit